MGKVRPAHEEGSTGILQRPLKMTFFVGPKCPYVSPKEKSTGLALRAFDSNCGQEQAAAGWDS